MKKFTTAIADFFGYFWNNIRKYPLFACFIVGVAVPVVIVNISGAGKKVSHIKYTYVAQVRIWTEPLIDTVVFISKVPGHLMCADHHHDIGKDLIFKYEKGYVDDTMYLPVQPNVRDFTIISLKEDSI